MRQVVMLLLAAACVFGAAPQAHPQKPSKTERGPKVAADVADRIAQSGQVRVVVELEPTETVVPVDVGHVVVREPLSKTKDRLLGHVSKKAVAKRLGEAPFIILNVDQADLAALAASSDVASVRLDRLRKPMLAESVPLIGAPTAWAAGAIGSGWSVAVVDSGVDKAHSFLAGKVVSEACYSTTDPAWNATSVCPGGTDGTASGSGVNCSTSVHGCRHGTHVAGIAAGTGPSFSGVAKNSSIISVQIYSRIDSTSFCSPDPSPCVGAFDSDVLAGLNRVYELRNTFNIGSTLLALGSGAYASTCDAAVPAYKTAIDQLRGANIPTVVSSGNGGSATTMQAPACVSTAISVGATTMSDVLETYTDRSAVLKLLAPGEEINSPDPGGLFTEFSGTSMAAAHVAGAWAIIRQRNPTATVSQVLTALTSTGVAITDPVTSATFRRINVGASLAALPLSFKRIITELPDLDGSNTADLLWKHTTPGTYAAWLMNGIAVVGSQVFGVDPSYQIFDFGDLNGDGRTDIIWSAPATGVVVVWFMNGTTVTGFGSFGPPAQWLIRAVNDVNGDGRDDLIWESPTTNRAAVWFMNGATLVGSAVFDVGAEWTLAGASDLNGDGRADFIWRSEVTGAIALWFMNGGTVQSTALIPVGAGWDLVATADGNGDGKSDFYWRNPTTGALAMWFMNGSTTQSTAVFGVGSGWDLVAVGDLNGDNRADVFWRSPSTETLAYWFMNGATVLSGHTFGVGAAWVPLVPE
jgi:subtilisin family serine protease